MERLNRQNASGPDFRHYSFLRGTVLLSCAVTVAALLAPYLVLGFLTLFRSILEALFLPFKMLLDLAAAWLFNGSATQGALSGVDSAAHSAGTAVRFLHAYLPSFLIIAGGALYWQSRFKRRTPQVAALAFHLAAAILIFSPIVVFLLPSLIAEVLPPQRKTPQT